MIAPQLVALLDASFGATSAATAAPISETARAIHSS
jgi:hypothetical protein